MGCSPLRVFDLGLSPASDWKRAWQRWWKGGEAPRAILWNGNELVDLNQQIDLADQWELRVASDINDHGQVVGTGLRNGKQEAYLLTPIETISERKP